MIFVASSCLILIISFILTSTAQAIYSASIPDYLPGFSAYDVKNFGGKLSKSTNDTTQTIKNQINSTEVSKTPKNIDEQTIYVIEFDAGPDEKDENGKTGSESDNQSPWDPWSIVWYIGSFGGLVAFFLIVSCSEWFCRRNAQPLNTGYNQRNGETVVNTSQTVTETPPPPYHLFAPPSYDSINYHDLVDKTTGEKLNIYVISVPFQDFQGPPQPAPA